MSKAKTIKVKGSNIAVIKKGERDFISLTDMVKNFDDGLVLIEKWLRNKNTIEFIGIWEQLNNPDFNSPEFEGIKNEAGLNRFTLSVNYRIHTDAIKAHLIPPKLSKKQTQWVYASEADLLNMALFGQTAADWRKENPNKEGNIRDHATLEQLVVLANLESMNALFIQQEMEAPERLKNLNQQAIQQMKSLLDSPGLKALE